MADSRETGLRVGAGYNQAAMIASQLAGSALLNAADIPDFIEGLAQKLITSANATQAAESVVAQFAGTTTIAPAPPERSDYRPMVTASIPTAPAPGAPSTNGYNTEFSGSHKPLRLSEHPELDGWLHAQAAAKGVYEVWDNRGKPNYIAAINSGASKTPPPFRSATDGNDTSFWPPK